MRGENLVAHLDGLCGTPVAHHCCNTMTVFENFGETYSLRINIINVGTKSFWRS
jgi:hypothetical protein